MKLRTAINQSSNIKAIVVVGDKSCYVKVSRATARELVSEYLDSTWDGESYYDESGTSIAYLHYGETYSHLYIG
tara:strand:- start:149 stop:370 length:222 start_codon:yes stop_codon:yes gene_type:complete